MSKPRPDSESWLYNSRLGLLLFFIYLAFYVGFVLINALKADWMEWVVFSGLNLAIVYGFGLIVLALLLALIYGAMCRREVEDDTTQSGDSQ